MVVKTYWDHAGLTCLWECNLFWIVNNQSPITHYLNLDGSTTYNFIYCIKVLKSVYGFFKLSYTKLIIQNCSM
jgi:hypothetical protein